MQSVNWLDAYDFEVLCSLLLLIFCKKRFKLEIKLDGKRR